MSTAPDHVNIEIDGVAMKAPKGSMIIHAADRAGIAIPRFCYHNKLPIAANCRMCLVDVEKAPKPMPACATPVMEGMKVYTQSKRALDSQRNVMEFLLINHPLDCPICDQGGECELQDVAMGYGRSVSRFAESKRVVPDEDMGPLIATDMTRCIHCTRCVRFVSEIAGTYEFGGMSRGEDLQIGTYIGKNIESELSGNVIDVCPVGALTNKPFRFRARAWELTARASIGYHDALGSNLFLHTRRGEVLRCVPRDNESINEGWLSDRDRYSHQGLYSSDRAIRPMIRKGEAPGSSPGQALIEVEWNEAIAFVAQGLKQNAGNDLGALVAPLTSCEEGHLLAGIVRGLGSDHIDHRLRTRDFSDHPAGATFEMPLAGVEASRGILLIGTNPRLDQPILGHRLRKAWKRGAKIFAVNPLDFDFHFELAGKRIVGPWQMLDELAALAKAAAADAAEGVVPDASLAASVSVAVDTAAHHEFVRVLRAAHTPLVIFGDFAVQHPAASRLRALARFIAKAVGAAFNELPSGANAVGLARVGVLPLSGGLDAGGLLKQARKTLIVYQAGSQDTAAPAEFDAAREAASFCVYIGAYACSGVRAAAHAVLPIGLPPEIDGSFVNVDGTVQSYAGGAKPPGEARPGWRVLRALGAALGLDGFDFVDMAGLRSQVSPLLISAGTLSPRTNGSTPANAAFATGSAEGNGLVRIATVPIYRSDAVVRRAKALQTAALAKPARVVLNAQDALMLGLDQGAMAKVSDGAGEARLPVEICARVPRGGAWVEMGHSDTRALAGTGTALQLSKA